MKDVPNDCCVHLLSGTPLTSRPRDLFPLLQLVRHPLGRSYVAFIKRYCDAYRGEYGWVADGASNIEELTVQLHGIMLRRTKTQVLDLPPKIRTWLDVDVSSQVARRISAAVLENLRHTARRIQDSDRSPATAQQRGQVLGQLTTARLRLAVAKVRSTAPFIENVLEQGEKAIVFSCFLRPISLFERRFPGQTVVISGEVDAEERQRRADLFQHDEQVRLLVANINAGGVGLNLTAARQVVFNDLDWAPTNHWQAEDRAFRIGQQHAVNVTYMVATGTVDEFVRTVLETKAILIDQLIDGSALPQDMGQDVMGHMRRLIEELDVDLERLPAGAAGEAEFLRLLGQAGQRYRQSEAVEAATPEAPMPFRAAAIATLARVLAGPQQARYRVESTSKKGAFYQLEVIGSDVSCSCKGFSYRGVCQHARALKKILVQRQDLPEGFSRIDN